SGGFDYQGIAPDAKIIPLKVADPTGHQDDIEFAKRVERALRWVERNRVAFNISIVNLSIRVPSAADYEATFKDEVERLGKAGVFMVGSGGHFVNKANFPELPAADPYIYAAGMIDQNDHIPDAEQRGADLDILGPGGGMPI